MATAARLNAILADADERSHRSIVTPEGVALPVELGARSERAAAFLIDLLIITGCFIALGLLALAAGLLGFRSHGDRGVAIWVWIALLLGWFLVRSFYFALFELRWHGSTPGKRVFRLRVIDRAGGALTADAVIARNLMREIEVFLPLSLIMVGLGTDMNGFIELAMLGWMLIFTFMPLFNRDRLRVGDMVGGTWVITAPKATLLPDLAEPADSGRDQNRRQLPTRSRASNWTPTASTSCRRWSRCCARREPTLRACARKSPSVSSARSIGRRRPTSGSMRKPSCRPSTPLSAAASKRRSCSASGARTSTTVG